MRGVLENLLEKGGLRKKRVGWCVRYTLNQASILDVRRKTHSRSRQGGEIWTPSDLRRSWQDLALLPLLRALDGRSLVALRPAVVERAAANAGRRVVAA